MSSLKSAVGCSCAKHLVSIGLGLVLLLVFQNCDGYQPQAVEEILAQDMEGIKAGEIIEPGFTQEPNEVPVDLGHLVDPDIQPIDPITEPPNPPIVDHQPIAALELLPVTLDSSGNNKVRFNVKVVMGRDLEIWIVASKTNANPRCDQTEGEVRYGTSRRFRQGQVFSKRLTMPAGDYFYKACTQSAETRASYFNLDDYENRLKALSVTDLDFYTKRAVFRAKVQRGNKLKIWLVKSTIDVNPSCNSTKYTRTYLYSRGETFRRSMRLPAGKMYYKFCTAYGETLTRTYVRPFVGNYRKLRVATYNIHRGLDYIPQGSPSRAPTEAARRGAGLKNAIDVIKRNDVAFIQEIQINGDSAKWFRYKKHRDQVAYIKKQTGYYVLYAKIRRSAQGEHGIAIFSRYRMKLLQVLTIPGSVRKGIAAKIEIPGHQPVVVINHHIYPKAGQQQFDEIKGMMDWQHRYLRTQSEPTSVIIGGDMNFDEFRGTAERFPLKYTKYNDSKAKLRLITKVHRFRDSFYYCNQNLNRKNPPASRRYTSTSRHPTRKSRIDMLFSKGTAGCINYWRGDYKWSDHYPFFASFYIPPIE